MVHLSRIFLRSTAANIHFASSAGNNPLPKHGGVAGELLSVLLPDARVGSGLDSETWRNPRPSEEYDRCSSISTKWASPSIEQLWALQGRVFGHQAVSTPCTASYSKVAESSLSNA